jgi:hypothetical protein
MTNPVRRSLAHQFPSLRVDAASLLVAAEGKCGGHEPRLQTAVRECLTSEVLGVEGGGGRGHQQHRWLLYP